MNNAIKMLKFNTISSTHTYAQQLIDTGLISKYISLSDEKSYCIVTADKQTNGIGKGKRCWLSPRGNLFASVITQLPQNEDLGELSLTVGCAIRDTIVHVLPDKIASNVKLHWPNDVYYCKKKISGILLSVSNGYCIISIGINTNIAPYCNNMSTSIKDILEDKDTAICSQQILNIILEKMEQWFLYLNNIGFSCIRTYWLQHISDINCNVTVKNGTDSITGFFIDIDAHGRLVLEQKGEYKFISSGDLFRNQEGIIIRDE